MTGQTVKLQFYCQINDGPRYYPPGENLAATSEDERFCAHAFQVESKFAARK